MYIHNPFGRPARGFPGDRLTRVSVAGSHGGVHLDADWVKNPSVGCTHGDLKSGFESPPTSEVEASEVVVHKKDETLAFFPFFAFFLLCFSYYEGGNYHVFFFLGFGCFVLDSLEHLTKSGPGPFSDAFGFKIAQII